jgi:RNA polymerase sigma factor (sigma-70 family)
MTNLAMERDDGPAATIRLASSGDEVAFARLVAEYSDPMARVAMFVAGDPDIAAEAVQASWTIAWRKLERLREPARLRPWLVSIAANEARQLVRRQRRRRAVELSVPGAPTDSGDPADDVRLVDLVTALDHLGPSDRALLALRFAAGLDSPEIATAVGMSPSGVRMRIARLLDRLRRELDR